MSNNRPGKPIENAHTIDELIPSLLATVAVTSQPHDLEVIIDQLCAPLLAASAITYEGIDTALRFTSMRMVDHADMLEEIGNQWRARGGLEALKRANK